MQEVKVLLVEDDEMTSEYLATFLRDSGFDVDTVFSVTDGISYLKQNHYDILLLDINLPDFSGMELLKSIKGSLSLPVIVLSAYGDTKSKIMAFRYGATDYMVKPIDLEELEARIWVQLGKNSLIPADFEEEAFRIETSDILLYGKPLNLTWTEFKILQLLLQNKNPDRHPGPTPLLPLRGQLQPLIGQPHQKHPQKDRGQRGQELPQDRIRYGVPPDRQPVDLIFIDIIMKCAAGLSSCGSARKRFPFQFSSLFHLIKIQSLI